jgi:hypothetical protein
MVTDKTGIIITCALARRQPSQNSSVYMLAEVQPLPTLATVSAGIVALVV